MKGFLICTGKRAEQHPLYIYETKTNIYSVEELCYYIYNNIESLDEQIFNAQMADFFERCDRLDLAEYLRKELATEESSSVEEVIRNIFKEINYYDKSEIEELCLRIRRLAEQPLEQRLKSIGDILLNAGKYAMAEKKYRRLLDLDVNDKLPASFYGTVWHNLGVVYARMMYFGTAAECFEASYKLYPKEEAKKLLVMSLTFLGDNERLEKLKEKDSFVVTWQEELKEMERETVASLTENGMVSEVLKLRNAGKIAEYRDRVNMLIEKWKTQYREQTK